MCCLCCLAWGQVLLFWGANPSNEAGSSTAGVDDEFNTNLDDFLRDD